MSKPFDLAVEAAEFLGRHVTTRPRLALTLGSGLGEVVGGRSVEASIPFHEVPGFPPAAVDGHAGMILMTRLSGVPAMVYSGRLHGYEGHDLATVVHPVRVAARVGVDALVITCAAGGIRDDLTAGDLVIVTDHLNPSGQDPLRGPHDPRLGPRFPSLVDAYDPGLRERLARSAVDCGVRIAEGVYARVPGPSYETPADVRALRTLGADLVGMSVVPEVIAARQMGLRVAVVAVITNRAAGLADAPPRHDEVVTVGRDAAGRLAALLERFSKEWSDG